MLKARIGDAYVLARPAEARMWVLDKDSAILWDLYALGEDLTLLADRLGRRFRVDIETARAYLDRLQDSWRENGLLERDDVAIRGPHVLPPLPALPPPALVAPSPDAWRLTIACQKVLTWIDDAALRAVLRPLLEMLFESAVTSLAPLVADSINLSGDAVGWRVRINGVETNAGDGIEAAIVAMLAALTEIGCRTPERLVVLHGGGLVAPDGRGLLLVAPGGSGKTTLCMGLEAEGFRMLSDDVVPIRGDGAALGLGLPACVKSGSWSVLAGYRPDLALAPQFHRYGQFVRFLPPRSRPMTDAIAPSLLLFPQYMPGAAPSYVPLTPEKALQALVQAEAVIRLQTQAQLEAVCGWIDSIPAYTLRYPDLASGMSLVSSLLENGAVGFR